MPAPTAPTTKLLVAVGDIHGRFQRVEAWLAQLEAALGREADAVLAVGDVEAFRREGDPRRKVAKRGMPAEFAAYAEGDRRFPRPLYFIGGNNEDFEALHDKPQGFELAHNVHYLGRVGERTVAGVRVGFLSGIHAPRFFEQPLLRPRSLDTAKQAGYFRAAEVERALRLRDVDVLLLHEWPRGLVPRPAPGAPPPARPLPSNWIGNPITRRVVESVRPGWALCGHSHRGFAASLGPPAHPVRIACLDQAARADEAVFWLEYEGRRALRAGWGLTGEVAWRAGEPWDLERVPRKTGPATSDDADGAGDDAPSME